MKKTVLFGSGTVAEKNLDLKPSFIVDNNIDLIGTKFHGIEIRSPELLRDKNTDFNVVVCTTSVSEVKKQLTNYGFLWGNGADVAVQLAERSRIMELEEKRFSFLVSSGLPSTAESFSGGGIYHVVEDGDYPNITKIYEGNTHGLINVEDGFAFTCQGEGIISLDASFNIVNTLAIRKGLRPHGIRRYNNSWIIVSSLSDCIIGIDDNGKELFEYRFSEKLKMYGSPQHHCNDVDVIGDFAYVSMFSVTGNWKRNVFDGGIVEVNLRDGEMKVIVNNLTMPHSVVLDDDGIKVLDSFKGFLLGSNFQQLAQLPGFVRGYASDSKYFYMGESKNRNFSRLDTGRTPVSIDTRITIMDKEFGFSRSIPLPPRISELHSIINLV